ncbi:alpha/beta hydrolase [Aeoliella straminimaris]|uniref:alpha/beta hydrolase n=1 Tax=Aeoliella straminimaris TaxID=2954799 RepID=UPI002093F13E|nr:alpha/beta hydrolase [Aeoliella straminimaris]
MLGLTIVSACSTGCVAIPASVVTGLEQHVLYQPTRELDYTRVPPGLEYQDVEIHTAGSPTIHGWYCPVENPRAVVLFAHGNAGNVSHRAHLLQTWTRQLQVSMLVFDYRGYGRSEGTPSEAGLVDDARRARDWLAQQTGTAPEDIVLYGRSLGGAVMVELAANDGARGLILESTFTSLPELADWKLPHSGVGGKLDTQFPSIERLPNFHGPVLIAHGSDDVVIPQSHGRALFEAANQPKQFVPIKGAKHDWAPPFDYLLTVSRFIDRLDDKTFQPELASPLGS